jgi:spoIIIJ-associated protein
MSINKHKGVPLETAVEIAKELMTGLMRQMDMEVAVETSLKEGNIWVEIQGDSEGVLIGKHGRTLESLQLLVNRMVNRRVKEPVRVIIDIDNYRLRRSDSLIKMAIRLGEKVKMSGMATSVGPFNAHDRRIIHLALKEDPSLETESQGEGIIKKVKIIPKKKDKCTPLE